MALSLFLTVRRFTSMHLVSFAPLVFFSDLHLQHHQGRRR